MNLPVGLRIMYCDSFPSGTGSYCFMGRYEIIVKNLGYHKKVAVWKQKRDGSWGDVFAEWKESMPGGFEKWETNASEGEHLFVTRYEDVGNNTTYWDNNNGWNYKAPQVCDEFAVVTGHEFPIVHGQSTLINGKLRIHAAIQNLAYNKIVGVVYTTDNWQTHHTIYSGYYWTMKSGIEVWLCEHNLQTRSEVEFALFYTVNGVTHWDNNFNRNYKVLSKTVTKAMLKESCEEKWDKTVKKEIPEILKRNTELEREIKPLIKETELVL